MPAGLIVFRLMETCMKSLCLLTSACLIFSHFAVAQNGIKSGPFSVVIDVGPAIQQTKSGGGLIEINPGYTLRQVSRGYSMGMGRI